MGKKRRRRKHSSGLTEKPLFEGVLMKNQNKYAIEVRKSDGELQTVVKNATADPDRLIYKIPFVRGIFVLVQNMILELESLEFSADAFGNDTSKETFVDRILRRLFGRHTNMIVTAGAACISFVICMFVVTAVPFFLARYLERYIVNNSVIHIIEFAASVLIMVLYLMSFLLFKDVRRMMKYHAAEHMCINCIERGRKLNYKNVASSSKFFPRCSTNYIAFCIFISIVLFVFVRIDSVPLRLLFRLLYIPLATGLFYEFYVLISSINYGFLLKLFTFPSVIFQVFSTLKPDDEMISTAIASLDAVFDWREFLVINFPHKYSNADFGLDKKDKKAVQSELIAEQKLEKEIEDEYARVDEELIQSVYENNEEVNINESDNADGGYYKDESEESGYYYAEGDDETGAFYTDENGEDVYYYTDENGEEVYYYADENSEYAEAEIIDEEEYIEDKKSEDIKEDIKEETVFTDKVKEVDDMEKTQPVSIDFMDDYGFDPEDEEVDESKMVFEPVDEHVKTQEDDYEYEEGNVPLFSKEIESIPMPESLDNIVEVMPQGGVKARVYINPEEAERNEFDEDDDDEDIDFDNIIDENGQLTLKDTDAFNRMLDDEYEEMLKRLGLDSDDL